MSGNAQGDEEKLQRKLLKNAPEGRRKRAPWLKHGRTRTIRKPVSSKDFGG